LLIVQPVQSFWNRVNKMYKRPIPSIIEFPKGEIKRPPRFDYSHSPHPITTVQQPKAI
jgi:hypothetical protein